MCGLCIICKSESQQHASANMLSFLRHKTSTNNAPLRLYIIKVFSPLRRPLALLEIYNGFVVASRRAPEVCDEFLC